MEPLAERGGCFTTLDPPPRSRDLGLDPDISDTGTEADTVGGLITAGVGRSHLVLTLWRQPAALGARPRTSRHGGRVVEGWQPVLLRRMQPKPGVARRSPPESETAKDLSAGAPGRDDLPGWAGPSGQVQCPGLKVRSEHRDA